MSLVNRTNLNRSSDFTDLLPSLQSQLSNIPTPSAYFRWKAVIDRLLAAILLIPGLPIIGLLVLLVRLTSRGPGIYRQDRVGKHGREFRMYKIRTMARDAEARTGPVWSQANDARATLVGRALRKLHLDEFPQLFNVLRGEMSLVGPRPERPEFVSLLVKQIPGYLNRLAVMPGITGLAQINLPPDSDFDSVRHKLVLDLEYIKHAGPLLDIRMFLCTSLRLLGLSGDLAMRIMGLRREVESFDGYEFPIYGDTPPTLRIKPSANGPGSNNKSEAKARKKPR